MDSNKTHALTQGQIEKAAEAAWKRATEHTGWMGLSDRWEEVKEVHIQEWRDIATAVAPHLQYAPAPAQILGDVVEAMCDTVVRLRARLSLKELTGSITMTAEQLRESINAAALVLLERAYADVGFDDEEWRKACTFFPEQQLYALTHAGLHHFFKLRRASLLKPTPPTLEQDVTKAVYSVTGTSKPWLEHDMVAAIMEALACRSSGGSKCDCHLRENQVCDVCQKTGMKENK